MDEVRIDPLCWREIELEVPPRAGRRGRPWRNHRQVIEGILWKLTTGRPWRDLPRRYGPWQTAYDRYSRWRRDGTWERIAGIIRRHAQPAAACAEAQPRPIARDRLLRRSFPPRPQRLGA